MVGSDIEEAGTFIFKMPAGYSQTMTFLNHGIMEWAGGTVTAGGNTLTSPLEAGVYSSFTFAANQGTEMVVKVHDKYSLTKVELRANNTSATRLMADGDLSELAYNPELEELETWYNTKVKFNIDKLFGQKNADTLVKLDVGHGDYEGYNIEGNIESLIKHIHLTTLNVNRSKFVYGELQKLAEGQCQNGRIDGTLIIPNKYTGMTWRGIPSHYGPFATSNAVAIKYTSTGCEVRKNDASGDLVATYTKANNTWSYE
jgi:hypothetical protein